MGLTSHAKRLKSDINDKKYRNTPLRSDIIKNWMAKMISKFPFFISETYMFCMSTKKNTRVSIKPLTTDKPDTYNNYCQNGFGKYCT